MQKINSDVKDHFMELSPDLGTGETTEDIRYGQLFRYEGRYYVKNSQAPTPEPNVGLANTNDISALNTRIDLLQNIVGDANTLLEAALHYQNGG
jgi:hypothetical protein